MSRTKRQFLTTAVCTCALGAASPAALAGEPFTVGQGKDPHIFVEPGSGTAHVLWSDYDADNLQYCKVPRGATACSEPTRRTFPLGFDAAGHLVSDGTTLFIAVPYYPTSDTFLYRSADAGNTWTPSPAPQKVYDFGQTVGVGEPILSPGGRLTYAGSNPGRRIWSAPLDGSGAAATGFAELPDGGNSVLVYDPGIAATADGGLVATYDDLAKTSFYRIAPGGDPNAAGNWSGPTLVGQGDTARLAGGSSGVFLLTGTGGHQEVRAWSGTGFGAPVVISRETGYINDIHVGPSGAVAAIWRMNDVPHRLRFALSRDAGRTFSDTTIAREDSVMPSMDIALASDNKGFAVYEGASAGSGSRNFIRVANTDPVDAVTASPYAGPSRTVSGAVSGASIKFSFPRNCVAVGAPFRVRLTWNRQRRKGNLFVKVRAADFYIGTKRVKSDRKAPFSQVLTIPAAAPAKSYKLRARAFIKVRRGKSPTKSIRTTVKTCP